MDRRSFILTSLATMGAIATAKIAAAAELCTAPISPPVKWETLHVENELGNMLSFEGRALDWDPRDWTWRMYYADRWSGDPDGELPEKYLREVAYDFGIDDEEPDWLQRLEKELDEVHPKNGELSGQEDEFRFQTSSTARAYRLMKEILEQLPEHGRTATEEELGLWFQEDALGVIAYIGDGKAELLGQVLATLQLPIEVEEV